MVEADCGADVEVARAPRTCGMGLTIARRDVGMMGGELDTPHQPGEGALHSFNIPVELAPGADPETHLGG